MNEDIKDYIKWIEMAEKDLRIAQHLNEHFYPTPHDTICYHAQQSIEKAMKAFLIYHGEEYPKTHQLNYLRRAIEEKICPLDWDSKTLIAISRYEVISRYPTVIDCNEQDSQFALKNADKFLQSIEAKIIKDNMEILEKKEFLAISKNKIKM